MPTHADRGWLKKSCVGPKSGESSKVFSRSLSVPWRARDKILMSSMFPSGGGGSGERNLLVQNDSNSSSLHRGYDEEDPQSDRTIEAGSSTFFITNGDWDWSLDLDDMLHELCGLTPQETCGLNGLIVLGLVGLLMYILLAKSYDVSFWIVIVISSLFAIFYLYWVCIRSPSQYYSQVNSVTANYYQARASQSNAPGGEPENLETTDDIINTTTYQSAPAFGRGSIIGGRPGTGNFLI